MRHTIIKAMALAAVAMLALGGCHDRQKPVVTPTGGDEEEAAQPDSTVYGVCGDGTAMHTLQLVTDAGDTITYVLPDDDGGAPCVVGGLLAGDRMAVVGYEVDGELTATRVVNITTLQGKWTSIDKNFEIQEGGEVKSFVKAEQHPWTSWRILNGHLLLGKDTFDIDGLGKDSLYLENGNGIFVYKREL